MSPAVSMISSIKNFKDAGLHWTGNSPEELEAVTKEMLKKTDNVGQYSTKNDNENQRLFKTLAEKCGKKHGENMVKALAPISYEFLEMHVDLLKC